MTERWRHGVVIGKFLPPHAGHLHLIERARARVDRLSLIVCQRSEDPIAGALRLEWLRELAPGVEAMLVDDRYDADDSALWARLTLEWLGARPDVAFTSEDYGEAWAGAMGCAHVLVDRERSAVPISGTAVRQDPFASWEHLPPPVRAHYALRVVVLGAESTGTTTLARSLAERLGTAWGREVGREVTAEKYAKGDRSWSAAEMLAIAREQARREDLLAREADRVLVCDTDPFATLLWHRRYVGTAPPDALVALALERRPRLYLLTGDELPFAQDGLRDGEHVRRDMHQWFVEALRAQPVPWLLVTGPHERRLDSALAAITALVEGSAWRPAEREGPRLRKVAPRCPHVAEGCGGCAWQHLAPEAQREAKTDRVRDCLGHWTTPGATGSTAPLPMPAASSAHQLGLSRLRPILPAPAQWHYRNKMEFTFNPRGGLGLHPREDWDRVLPLETCLIATPLAVEVLRAARDLVRRLAVPLHDPRTHQGTLRQLIVRESRATGEMLIGLVTKPGPFPEAEELARGLAAVDPRVKGVIHAVQGGVDHGPIEVARLLHGEPLIVDRLCGLEFEIGLLTFFQTNTAAAELLVEQVLEMAGPLEGELAMDLFCGMGTFSLPLARRAGRVFGLELVPESIEAARRNAARNGISNAEFRAGEARLVVPELSKSVGRPRVVVLDPPRGGAGGRVIRKVSRLLPERVVYVACNPRTLAQDLGELQACGFALEAVQPVDLFPQTRHVEIVASMRHLPGAVPPKENERRRRREARRKAEAESGG